MKKKRLPAAKHVRFVLCEDARQEASGKSTLIGVYPGEIIVVYKPATPEGTHAVAALRSICLVFFVAGGVGRFDAGIRIDSPDGTAAFEQPVGVVTLEEHGTATIVGQIQPFLVKAFGVHAVTLSLDGRVYPFEFTIRESKTPPTEARIN
jgi:hypothetical protein